MKITAFILLVFCVQVSATTLAQNVTLSEHKAPLEKVINEIKRQTGYSFFYNEDWLRQAQPVDVEVKDAPLDVALRSCFVNQPYNYAIVNKTIVLKLKEKTQQVNVLAAPIDISGMVQDTTGAFIKGATITIKPTGTRTQTADDGSFSIKANPGDSLLITFVGYKPQKYLITQSSTYFRIILHDDQTALKEVLVNNGYQTLPKERATGSFEVIDSKKINEQVGTNILDRLNGISSLNVISAKTGGFTIRGTNTINGNSQPLIVVDNFPYDGDINNINPDNIASVTVLKDAAAASIWGARAGNGVLVITTKKGNFNQNMKVSLTTGFTQSDKPNLFAQKLISPSDYIDLEKLNFQNGAYDGQEQAYNHPYLTPVVEALIGARDGKISNTQADAIIGSYRNHDIRTDLMKLARKPFNQYYSLNISGGSNNTSYFLSGGYNKDLASNNESSNRITINAGNTYKIIKDFSLTTTLAFTQQKGYSGDRLTTNNSNYAPYTKLIDANGNALAVGGYRQSFLDTVGHGKLLDWHFYPATDPANQKTTNTAYNFTAGLSLQYQFLKDFKADLSYQFQQQSTDNKIVLDQSAFANRDLINTYTVINPVTGDLIYNYPLGSLLGTQNDKLTTNNVRGMLSYGHNWNKHELNVIAGGELSSNVSGGGLSQTLYGYTDDPLSFTSVNTFTNYPTIFGDSGNPFANAVPMVAPVLTNHVVSAYANASYTYDEKYIFSLSGRRDATNVYGVNTNNKWNPLWSTGFAWKVSKEKFYHLDILPVLNLRATYGVAGNNPTDPALTVINFIGTDQKFGEPISRVNKFANPGLKWELVKTINLAIDFELKNGRFSGSIEYYKKKDGNLFGPSLLDPTLGLTDNVPLRNIASMNSKGFDISLRSINLSGPIEWRSNFILASNENRVTNYYNPVTRNNQIIALASTGHNPIAGQSLRTLVVYKSAGLDRETGAPMFLLNGKPSKDYNAIANNNNRDDIEFKGSLIPTALGSLGNSLNWKNLNLSFNIVYKIGYYFLKPSVNYNLLVGGIVSSGSSDYALRWQKTGDEARTNIPSFQYPGNRQADALYNSSDILVRKGDHIRLQYVNLGYTFTRKLFPSLPLEQLSLTLNAANLGILWRANKDGLDPDTYNSMPASKTYSLTLHTNF